jgi:hypothetical protein
MSQSESEARLASILHLNKGKPTVQVQAQDPPGRPSQATSIPSMPSLNLRLCCVIEGERIIFPVDITVQADVVDLKKKIQSERASYGYPPSHLGVMEGIHHG